MTTEARHLRSPHQAHKELLALWADVIKPATIKGQQGILSYESLSPAYRQALRGALHATLRQMALETWFISPTTGLRMRYTLAAWKELMKQWFLDDPSMSSEALSDYQYARWLMQVQAFAVMELNMELEGGEE